MKIDVDECAIGDDFYFRQNDYNSAFICYSIAAKKDNLIALYMLGRCYYRGTGVEENLDTAIKYWQTAFDKGDNCHSAYELGCCYFFGEGVKEDEKESFRLWSIAANNGHRGAMDEVGNSYFHGTGVERDMTRAHAFWKKACECRKALKK